MIKSIIKKFRICNNNKIISNREKELESLVREIYEWTYYKNTAWAIRAKKAIDDE